MKKRSSKYRIRDGKGRFVSTLFTQLVKLQLADKKGIPVKEEYKTKSGKIKERKIPFDRVMEEAKITDSELKEFFEGYKKTFHKMYEKGSLQLFKNSGSLESALDGFGGKVVLNGEKVKADKVLLVVSEFKQWLSSSLNSADFDIVITQSFDGNTLTFDIPDTDKLEKDLCGYLGAENIDEVFDEFTANEIIDAINEILASQGYQITVYGS